MTGRGALIIGTLTALAAAAACLHAGHVYAATIAAFYAGWLAGSAATMSQAASAPAGAQRQRTNWTGDIAELADRCELAGKLAMGVTIDAPNARKLSRLLKEMAAELDDRGSE